MEDLRIAQKTEEMIQYGNQAVRHFPKSERHVLSQELRLSITIAGSDLGANDRTGLQKPRGFGLARAGGSILQTPGQRPTG